jgi:signal transduction histidine kinase
VLGAALVLFAAVFVLRQSTSNTADAIAVLYVVPISLVALELGLVAGLCSVALAIGLVGIWSLTAGLHLGGAGFATTAIAFLAVGAVAGRFGDRMREVHERQLLLLDSGLRLAHLDEGNELPATLAQQARELVGASWTRAELSDGPVAEAGTHSSGAVIEQIPIAVHGTRYGMLTVTRSHQISGEDFATLEILALQAAVAAENRRLLASELERTIIQAELHDARLHLAERGGQLRELITRQETERYRLAYELNEQAAQSLAAVLLGLAALERELRGRRAAELVGALRSDVDSTLRALRSLAVGLRPPALELGLRTALQRLSDAARVRGFGEIEIDLDSAGGLSEESETMVYRAVEEALEAVGAAHSVSVRASADGSELAISVEDAERSIAQGRLAVLRARMELIGGTLSATTSELRAVMPLRPEA